MYIDREMFRTFSLVETSNKMDKIIAEGCILPDQQVAIVRTGEITSLCIYPSYESFEKLQSKMRRKVVYHEKSVFGGSSTFKLVREEDITGISGTGIVAEGCYFYALKSHPVVVIQWNTEYATTCWFNSLEDLDRIHGHDGRTKIIMDAD